MLTLVGIIVPLIIGIWVARYYSNRRDLSVTYFERRVLFPIGEQYPTELEIVFQGRPVKALSEWSVAIWNSGNQTIQDSDVASVISLEFPEGHLLKFTEPVASRETSNPRISSSENAIDIAFDYLDAKDVIAFSVYIEPGSDGEKLGVVNVSGQIRGIPNGPSKRYVGDTERFDLVKSILLFVVATLLLPIGLFAVYKSGSSLGFWQSGTLDALQTWWPFRKLAEDGNTTFEIWLGLIFGSLLSGFMALGVVAGALAIWEYFTTPVFLKEQLGPRLKMAGKANRIRKFAETGQA